MQGRLSPVTGGRIQAFPWPSWKEEFSIAEQTGFHLMEWTLDHDRLYENPLLTSGGQAEIRELCRRHGIAIHSLTGDCFMQVPFWKKTDDEREPLVQELKDVADACTAMGISMVVLPLVDNGRIDNDEQEEVLITVLDKLTGFLDKHDLRIVFESDLDPEKLACFIERLDPDLFGINYDSGNSAAMGFEPTEEFDAYGHRVANVHVKDRLSGGTTVPLGSGDTDFKGVFSSLAKVGYKGNYILQTARADDGDHAGKLCHYRDLTAEWMDYYGA